MTAQLKTFVIAVACISFAALPLIPVTTSASVRIDNFVRSGNQYLKAGSDLHDEDLPQLSRFDLLVLPAEAQIFNPNVASRLRTMNPDIVILAYVPTVSYNNRYWTDSLHRKLESGLTERMELHDSSGRQMSVWPQTSAYNVSNRDYVDVWVDYVATEIWPSGYWDGIFLDEVSGGISWLGDVDLTQNGRADSASAADRAWKAGYVDMFSSLRARVGSEAVLITNGSSDAEFQPYVNGRMFESFPTPWEGSGSWQEVMNRMFQNIASNQDPDVFFINSNTGNSGNIDYAQMRFGLTSALLGGAFFGYDFGETSHAQLWVFDEYEAFLGRMVDTPKDELSPGNTTIRPSVWSRDFQEGKVLVNSTNRTHTISLGEDYEKINGTQDRSVNDGRVVTQVTIPPQDGVVLLRPIEELLQSQFQNGSFVRIFDTNGNRERTGFFAYTGATLGGNNIVRYDFDKDGLSEIVSADDTRVRIHSNSGAVMYEFCPYGCAYASGINLAVGDFENDGRTEIITGTKNGGGPHIRIFNHEGVLINPGFFAFHPLFRGGVNVTLGDLDSDGRDEIIVGAGVGGGPQVQIFNKDGRLLTPGFFAYDKSFRGGVNVAAGDVTGDGVVDIITGPGKGGAPVVRVFDNDGNKLTQDFWAFDKNTWQGVFVAASDLDGDGISELMALTTDVFTLAGN